MLKSRLAVLTLACSLCVGTIRICGGAEIDPTMYGNLKQKDVPECPNEACGPTAAVNSMVFLQNMYPGIFDHNFVGFPGGT
jgi:hypothetical protein